jgi:hypothetical protein
MRGLNSGAMLYEFSLPTKSDKVPPGADWIHEIKYDGYRMLVVRDQDRVRLVSRGGYDWADRCPLIVAGALELPERHFVLDGEVVVLRQDGTSDFDALASRKHDKRAMLYAFDLLAVVEQAAQGNEDGHFQRESGVRRTRHQAASNRTISRAVTVSRLRSQACGRLGMTRTPEASSCLARW